MRHFIKKLTKINGNKTIHHYIGVVDIFLLVSFGLLILSCNQSKEEMFCKEIGSINLKGKDLIISVPKKDLEEKLIRFYLASVDRKSENNNADALQIAFYDTDFMMITEEVRNGRFDKDIYYDSEIKKDSSNFYLIVPNRLLFDKDMRLWSAYDKIVTVDHIKLGSKKTGKIEESDPYIYIKISK